MFLIVSISSEVKGRGFSTIFTISAISSVFSTPGSGTIFSNCAKYLKAKLLALS